MGCSMDFSNALQEVDREDGFWAHLVNKNGNAYSWKRFEEQIGGGWSQAVLDEGDFNAYEFNHYTPPHLPWVVWIQRGAPDDFRFTLTGGGGRDSFWARITAQNGHISSWKHIKEATGGQWIELEEGGEGNAYEANGRTLERLPWNVRLCPRSIDGGIHVLVWG